MRHHERKRELAIGAVLTRRQRYRPVRGFIGRGALAGGRAATRHRREAGHGLERSAGSHALERAACGGGRTALQVPVGDVQAPGRPPAVATRRIGLEKPTRRRSRRHSPHRSHRGREPSPQARLDERPALGSWAFSVSSPILASPLGLEPSFGETGKPSRGVLFKELPPHDPGRDPKYASRRTGL